MVMTVSLQRKHASACEDVGFSFVFAPGSINCESLQTSKTLLSLFEKTRTESFVSKELKFVVYPNTQSFFIPINKNRFCRWNASEYIIERFLG